MKYYLVPVPVLIEKLTGKYYISHDSIENIESYSLKQQLPNFIHFTYNSDLQTDAYNLVINESGIDISYSSDSGRFYGMKTLHQLCRQVDSDGHLSNIRIEDKPAFKNRAVMLDISRNKVPTMETIFHLVDFWSELKLNQLQLYTEHTFAYKKHEKVWKDASPFTAEEIINLDRYCKDRAIELVPNQTSFGHMERWLKHEDYISMAEAPDGFNDFWGGHFDVSSTFYPESEELMPFISGLYDELLPCFSSNTFNVGGDETYDLGQGKSKESCEKIGIGQVYLNFIKKLENELTGRGKKMQFWGDIILNHPELIEDIPKNLIAMNWGYEKNHPFEKETKAFADAGIEFYVCTGTSAWNSIAGRWDNALGNINSAAFHGLQNGATGFMITEWGDNGHLQQFPIPVPGYMAGASAAWSGSSGTKINFIKNLSLHYFKDQSGTAVTALLKMADLYKDFSNNMHNMSIFSAVLLGPSYHGYREEYCKFGNIDFSPAYPVIEQIDNLMEKIDLSSKYSDLLKKELLFTANLLRYSVDLASEIFKTRNRDIKEIDKSRKMEFSVFLKKIMEEFKESWLERNRPGGLSDSLDIFKKLDSEFQ
jgi:hexosaminidase